MADITITEGDTLEVDYSVENTGDGTGDQDIRLKVQQALEDTDANVVLDPGQTATGTLQWPTEDGDAVTDALAEALTDDTSDSITVTVERAIPDSAVYRWPVDEGSGQTLTDELQSTDINLTFSTWTTGSQYVGGAAIDLDGADDEGTTASALPEIGINQDYSVEVWTEPQGLGESNQANLIYQHPADDNRLGIGFDQNGNGTITGAMYNGSNFVAEASSSISTNDGLKQIVYTYDSSGPTGEIYVNTTQGGGTNRTNFTGQSDDAFYLGNNPGGESAWDGIVDLIQPHDEVLSQSQIDSLYQSHPST